MKYFALDVETANTDYSSICQIGIVELSGGTTLNEWSTLINPLSYFDGFNVSIHGITEDMVQDSPIFSEVYDHIRDLISNSVVIHHMPFDKTALNRVCLENNLPMFTPIWLDSSRIVKRVWSQFSAKGYGLKDVCDFLGYDFKHHDALNDAKAAGYVVHRALQETNSTIDDWLEKVSYPIASFYPGYNPGTIKQEGNPDGPFFGETVLFTGELALPRKEIASIASNLGYAIASSASKKVTTLVVGVQDSNKLKGFEKSSKHRAIEELISKGFNINILTEHDFVEMCNKENPDLHLKPLERKETTQPSERKEITIQLPDSLAKELEFILSTPSETVEEDKNRSADEQARIKSIVKRSIELLQLAEEEIGQLIETTESEDDEFYLDELLDQLQELRAELYELRNSKFSVQHFREHLKWFSGFILGLFDGDEGTFTQFIHNGNEIVVSLINRIVHMIESEFPLTMN